MSNTPDAATNKIVSAYAELHKSDWIPNNYDENIYNPAGYDNWVWDLYRPYLMNIVRDLALRHDSLRYLDFACGTGRILAALEGLTTESTGLDISPQMVEYARRKAPRSTVLCGDILNDPMVASSGFDLITAFRFFLNTETEIRPLVTRALADRLAGSNSRLIFNVHMNGWGADGLKSLYRRLHGWPPSRTMTYLAIRRMVEDAGLEIESWYGFALWPNRVYTSSLGKLSRWTDRMAAHVPPLRWISKDLLFVCRPRVASNPSQQVASGGDTA